MSYYAIFDLDNCLSNDEWRIAHIRFDLDDKSDEKWNKYHSLCAGDNPANSEVLMEALARGRKIAFVTMRPEAYRPATLAWIKQRLCVDSFMLMMRPNDDHRPSVELKRAAARQLLEGGHRIVEAYDDRADIVDMYRSLGAVEARVLKVHNLSCHRPPPATADDDANPARPAPDHPSDGRGEEEMPLAPPTRGEGPARTPLAAFPFTTDPLAAFEATTGAPKKCDGNHGGLPCPDPECWLRDAATDHRRADGFLEEATDMWRKKNAAYGDHYRRFGELALKLFPEGLILTTADDWNRLAVFIHVLTKVSRYAECMPMSGHADSALDLTVYAAMLRELTPA